MIRFVVCLSLFVSLGFAYNGCSMARTGNEANENQDAGNTTDQPSTTDQGTSTSDIKLVINEIVASGDPDDWVELYNPGDKAVDLSTLNLTDDANNPTKGTFEAGTTIAPKSYKVFKINDTWPGFKLGKDEEFAIFDSKGNLIASVDWNDGDSPAGASWARIPDITGAFKTVLPTPEAANKDQSPNTEPSVGPEPSGQDAGDGPEPGPEAGPEATQEAAPSNGKLVINEIAAKGDPHDWVELYNGTDKDIDLSDYSLSDSISDTAKQVKFPKGTVIKAGEYKKFDLQDAPEWPDFKLGNDEEVGLFAADGSLVDSVDWNDGDSPEGKSYGRLPGDPSKWGTLNTPTPGAKNQN